MAHFLIIASHDNDIIGAPPILHYGDKQTIADRYRHMADYGYKMVVCKVTAPLTQQALQSLLDAE